MRTSQEPQQDRLGLVSSRRIHEQLIYLILLSAAAISVATTFGIVLSLLLETIAFFREVPLTAFLFDTQWTPLFAVKRYGIWPLIVATGITSTIALLVAAPLGLIIALYLSEFASSGVRAFVKPVLELLAGIPPVVYGYIALITVTPALQQVIPGLMSLNLLTAGVVMGFMILPMVTSLSDDAISAVPPSLREGSAALGATSFDTAMRIIFPAAMSGIAAAVLLALSRALGETMIVAIAAGQNPTLTFDPRQSAATMTAYIFQVSLGDAPSGSIGYYTLYAVGLTLFVFTLTMNAASIWLVRRFREVYEE